MAASKKKRSSKASSPLQLTKPAVAQLLGVTVRQIDRYLALHEDPIPVVQVGRGGRDGRSSTFDATAVVEWWVRYRMRDAVISDDGEVYILEVEKARLTNAQADKAQMERDALRRSLIPIDEIRRVWGRALVELRTHVLALPIRVAPAVIGATTVREVEAAMRPEVEQHLLDLEELLREFRDDSGGGRDSGQAASASDG